MRIIVAEDEDSNRFVVITHDHTNAPATIAERAYGRPARGLSDWSSEDNKTHGATQPLADLLDHPLIADLT